MEQEYIVEMEIIVDQLEDEMNKNIETMKSDHELMKGQGQIFSPLQLS